MLEAGRCRSTSEIAKAEKIDRSFVSRLLNLTMLAPDIQEAILEGRQAKGIQLDELMGAMPGEWGEQEENLKSSSLGYPDAHPAVLHGGLPGRLNCWHPAFQAIRT